MRSVAFAFSIIATTAVAGVDVSLVPSAPAGARVAASYSGYDAGGNTSVAFDGTDIYKWSGASLYAHEDFGYYTPAGVEVPYIKRDRDLGQTFTYTGTTPAKLDAVTVRTGFGTNVIRRGMYGRAVSIQVFKVTGTPVLNDNGTPAGTEALHGFPHDRLGTNIPSNRDDYYTGEVYTSLAVGTGGTFPSKTAFGFAESADIDPASAAIKGKYLRWDLTGSTEVVLQPGERYAFLVMIDQMSGDSGFTLANHYTGSYAGGHGIRRDGNGVFPPVAPDPTKDFKDPANAAAYASAHFPADFAARTAIAPGTDGYPDVDTWRDFSFWVEVSPVPEPTALAVFGAGAGWLLKRSR